MNIFGSYLNIFVSIFQQRSGMNAHIKKYRLSKDGAKVRLLPYTVAGYGRFREDTVR